MLVTMKSSELFDRLVEIANGDARLVEEAIRASATAPDGEADLKDVVQYIMDHQREPLAA
ncbi:hypothetical protein HU675_0010715 [Bradyrhizobium septentrionale]|uniref:hypothetical protein n=1 Tax=Bradyrhizobium septentrionale TaxID=1404411 RepID=UPI001596B6CD|nr:hypothetical protein [Bradyrhizobium septentrionale]UGY27182.1 hypothetical protein HU675_0010715 [Bradyrhizobium septentrionale]